ncbi:MAG: SLC13 family permease [Desulforhopalus sp.]
MNVATISQAAPSSAAQGVGPVLPMVLIGIVLGVTFFLIATERMHKTLAAVLGAVVAVALALMLGVYDGERPYLRVHDFIHHDLGVIGVIVGTSIVVAIASDSGLFHFLAVRIVKLTRGNPRKLLPAIMAVTVAFVTFLTIAPGVLIMVSLVLVITKALDDDPKPYIIAVAIGANSGALMTFASGIPTLMIGTSARIPYVHFLIVSAPLAILSAVLAFFIILFYYRKTLAVGDAEELLARAAKVDEFDEWALVKDRSLFYRATIILGLTIIGFALAQTLGVGLDYIAFCGGIAALLFSGFPPDEAINKVKWSIILFFVGLFVLIGTVQDTGLLTVLAGGIYDTADGQMPVVIAMLTPFVFVTAGIVDNIPVAATMIPVVNTMVDQGMVPEPLWWTLIAACNLGGNPTPVGSIAAVIALHALEKERGIRIGWAEYLKVGGTVTILQIILVLVYIFAFVTFDLFPRLPV